MGKITFGYLLFFLGVVVIVGICVALTMDFIQKPNVAIILAVCAGLLSIVIGSIFISDPKLR